MLYCNESDFEKHIRSLLSDEIVATCSAELTVLENKGITDIVIYRDGHSPALFFIELKYAKDMIGVSEGIQSEILLNRPHYMERHLMWLIGSQDHEGVYWFLNSNEILEYVSKINLDKENNISRRLFRHQGKFRFNREGLVTKLCDWLTLT